MFLSYSYVLCVVTVLTQQNIVNFIQYLLKNQPEVGCMEMSRSM
jgi:hypothetical protein